MERKTAGLLGALAGFTAMGAAGAQAASHPGAGASEPLPITSYADLLRPVPNAVELLKAHDAELLEQARNAPARVENAQYYQDHGNGHPHHPHHAHYAPPPPHHHHHH